MKEYVKDAAKGFWSGFTSAIPDTLRYMRGHPRMVAMLLFTMLGIWLVSTIEGLLLFMVFIGSIIAVICGIIYMAAVALTNSWKPWNNV